MFLLVCFLRIAFLIVCKNCHFVREHKSIFTFYHYNHQIT